MLDNPFLMKKIHQLILPFLGLFLLGACQVYQALPSKTLQQKCAPYDQFSIQRAFPDRDFDWKGWKKTMTLTRMNTQIASERDPGGCGGNPSAWTLQGPANVGGRVNALAVKPNDELTVLAGFAGGGIFKTTDGGTNWRPVFDDQPELSIGDLTYDPVNPDIVYAGTGDVNIPAIVFNGDGIYKSTNGGENWQYLGLREAGIISKIVVNPQNTQVLYAAAMGNPYVRDVHRGIYKSTDGGQNWQKVLFISNQAGASDLVINPNNPQILYASFWDRIRNNQESVVYGPNAKVYKSIDGGQNWVQLGGGLPTGVMGRTGLAMSATNPDKLFVVYVDTFSRPGGLFRTTNGGATWTTINIAPLNNAYSDFGWYFGKIRLNPTNDEEVYFLGVLLWRRVPASGTWQNAAGGHADSHDWVQLPSGRRYWANDGGVYRSPPGQSFYDKCINLPTTQIYHTDFNPHTPNTFYIGAQDNGIQKGNGTALNNWQTLFTADGFNCVFDPIDPNTFWVEIQYGGIQKTTDGGQSWENYNQALGTSDRVNWDAPFFMSNFEAPKRYSATFRVYESVGEDWTAISGDLTDGVIYGDRFHTISALNESPLVARKLIAGTSDGNVWRKDPGGAWVNITAGLPNRYVTSVYGSPVLADRIFVTHSGFRDNESIPHIHRSDDNGQSWVDISGDLPALPVNDFWIMPGQNDQVLFAATDAGVYYTLNGGVKWLRLGSNLPFIPVFDIEHNPVRNELMAGTFARGLYTFPLDSVFQQGQSSTISVGGTIKTELGDGVGLVQVAEQPLVQTDTSGVFLIENQAACQQYTLQPQRNDNPLNGVSTFDLVLISKHILNIEPLGSPYKMIAADANKSNSITNFDIITIRKLILGIDSTFGNNQSWRFVPADYVFPNVFNPFQAQFPEKKDLDLQTQSVQGLEMIGIKTGDVNNNVTASADAAADTRGAGIWPLYFQDAPLSPDTQVTFILQGDFDPLAALQFTLAYNTEALELLEVTPLLNGLSADQIASKQGTIRFASETMPDGKSSGSNQLLRCVFRAKKGGRLSDYMQLEERPTPALAYFSNGVAWKPQLSAFPEKMASIQVWPNPVGVGKPALLQGNTLPEQAFDLEIWSAAGSLLHQQTGTLPMVIPATALQLRGVCFYRLLDRVSGLLLAGRLVVE